VIENSSHLIVLIVWWVRSLVGHRADGSSLLVMIQWVKDAWDHVCFWFLVVFLGSLVLLHISQVAGG
jgi:uncharacterized protein (DUF983 family)